MHFSNFIENNTVLKNKRKTDGILKDGIRVFIEINMKVDTKC